MNASFPCRIIFILHLARFSSFLSCMRSRQRTLTQSGTNNRVVGWTNFSHKQFGKTFNVSLDLSTLYFAHFSGC